MTNLTTFEVSRDTEQNASQILQIERIIKQKNSVVVFDFDGVLIDDNEERLYRRPEEEGERQELTDLAGRLQIDASIYDTKYLRHLVYQEVARTLDIPPKPGPFSGLAKKLTKENRPFFVLSARSSFAAISRAMDFLTDHSIKPQECFFVGRVGKGRQLRLVADSLGEASILYIEDSRRHVRNSVLMRNAPVKTVHVKWGNINRALTEEIQLSKEELKKFQGRLVSSIVKGKVGVAQKKTGDDNGRLELKRAATTGQKKSRL